jgi:hypothetical protein
VAHESWLMVRNVWARGEPIYWPCNRAGDEFECVPPGEVTTISCYDLLKSDVQYSVFRVFLRERMFEVVASSADAAETMH